jgi:hypothetical protein
MTFDMNDAELPRGSDLIPDGSFVKVAMDIRRGGLDGQGEADRGLLKAAKTPGSDVRMLDCEFTVVAGPHAKRKFWQMFTVAGGKVDEHGVSIGWKISKGTFRAMIDSALGLDPQDMSEPAKAKRMLRGLSDLQGITFAAKLRVEPASDPRYGDSNRLDRVVLPTDPEWRRIMDGEPVPAQPSTRPARTPAAVVNTAPVWAPPGTGSTAGTNPPAQAPLWAPQGHQAAPLPTPPAVGGPPWLNG